MQNRALIQLHLNYLYSNYDPFSFPQDRNSVTRELLRAKSLASLGCPKGIRFASPLHTRRALVALRRSRPSDTLVYHNINYVNVYTIIKTGGVTGFEEDRNCHSDKTDFLSNRENRPPDTSPGGVEGFNGVGLDGDGEIQREMAIRLFHG